MKDDLWLAETEEKSSPVSICLHLEIFSAGYYMTSLPSTRMKLALITVWSFHKTACSSAKVYNIWFRLPAIALNECCVVLLKVDTLFQHAGVRKPLEIRYFGPNQVQMVCLSPCIHLFVYFYGYLRSQLYIVLKM